ncbi:MAG: SPOR domain-containing protein [Rhodobacteraceae bacterium]|nr:SPOR domain-containing protein [Paracoccaceae bacterium]
MADFDHSDFGGAYHTPVRSTLSTALNWVGAILSLGLIAGLGYWAYQLVVRDVTGVPVVRAMEGPMRIAPEDPGGSTAAYQGLAVNAIAAEGTAEAPAEMVVLAPVEVNLTPEDRAMSALLPDAPEAPIAEVAAQPLSAIDLAVAAALGEDASVMLASQSVESAAEMDEAAMDPAVVAVEEVAAVGVVGEDEEIVPTSTVAATDAKGVIAVSPRPMQRPTRAVGTQVASLDPAVGLPQTETVEVAAIDVDSTTLPEGARLVQLGAYPTAELAREEWDVVAARFADFMQGKSRVIEQAEAGGRIFYRLRVAGFEDLADSRRFCAVLVAGEASCIPVAAR